jgi:hypothetical protein
LHQRKLRRQEKLFAKLRKRDEALAKLSEEELAKLVKNSKGTTEQRRRQAGKTLSELASLNGNGEFKHDETYWDKWQAIREEWAKWDEEDRQEAQREQPRFARRF